MRLQVAAANWKMNLTRDKAEMLLDELKAHPVKDGNGLVLVAVPFPYLELAIRITGNQPPLQVAAQNLSNKASGAYTGEVSAEMLQSLGVQYVLIGHSERREYFQETNEMLSEKVRLALDHQLKPVFCCGEALPVRESGAQNEFVVKQLEESLYGLNEVAIKEIIIAYEPIWAIGTGKTATSMQAQEMHAAIRASLTGRYGAEVADSIPILYGGSVKANNAAEIFGQPDVDGGLVGGASLVAAEFKAIIDAL